jgi:hypothetical protein
MKRSPTSLGVGTFQVKLKSGAPQLLWGLLGAVSENAQPSP